jgi:hypothetical protein
MRMRAVEGARANATGNAAGTEVRAPDRAPDWALNAGHALTTAASRIRMLACSTPLNLRSELDRLTERWSRSEASPPYFIYEAPPDHDEIRRALGELASWLDGEGPLGAVYAARARELCDEAAICSAAGTDRLRSLARHRFRRRDGFDDAADALAAGWLAEGPEDCPGEPRVQTDDEGCSWSLVSRMREELGTRRLPFRVVTVRDLSALAATGEGVVQVAMGRSVTLGDVERTVLHEIEGHVLPRCRAGSLRLGIFTVGTRWGADDQEGRALVIESEAGALARGRRRELALRHAGARMLEEGADFVETTRRLLSYGTGVPDALRITARVHRGGGLGREVVYLPAFLRVEAALAARPELDRVLGSGRVAVDAADVLGPWVFE